MKTTNHENWLSRSGERKLSLLLLLVAVAFGLLLVWPVMEFGYNGGGDDVVHMAYNHEARAVHRSCHKLFGWSYLFGMGAPIFLFRPPLQYLCVALLQALTFGAASLNAIHKLFYVCGLAFYPVSVYYMLHKLRFRPLVCAAAALLAITPISMWGHTLDAYFRLGVAKQLIAIFIFPFALGKIHGTVMNREAILPASLLTALCFLSHPYMAYCMALLCALYAAIVLLGSGLRDALICAARLSLTWGLAGLLLAFYLVPFYSSPEIQMLEFSSTWRHAFEVVCLTTAKTVNCLLQGGLFDTTRWYTYGGGEWGWQDNAFTGRWPIVTGLCLWGLVLCVRNRKRFNCVFVLSAFLLSFVMFLGPDDVPLLTWLPFQDQYQYIHGVFLLDLVAVCLAGIGFAALIDRLGRGVIRMPALSRTQPGVRRTVTVVACLLGMALVVCMPWKDRVQVADRIILKRNFDTRGSRLVPAALQHSVNRDFDKVVQLMKDPKYPGRFYGSAQGKPSDRELFYFTILPALCDRTNLICGFFSAEVGGVNKLVIERFRPAVPLYRNLVELFNVRYLVCAASNSDRLQAAGTYAGVLERNQHWVLWRAKGDYGHFAVVPDRPLLVLADRHDWTRLCRYWLEAFKDASEPGQFPYLVAADSDSLLEGQLDPDKYAGLIIMGADRCPDPEELKSMALFAAAGGKIVSQPPLSGVQCERFNSARDVDFKSLCDPNRKPAGNCRETIVERERHAARVTLEQSAFIVFKTAFYRGWEVEVDGQCLENVQIGPGFNGVYLPSGEHELLFRYRGPNRHAVGNMISIIALLGALGLTLAARRRGGRKPGESAPVYVRSLRLQVLILLTVLALVYLYVREQFLKIPVPIRPARGETVPIDVRLDWNALGATNVTYEVEIDDESPHFEHVIYHRDGLKVERARKHRGMQPERKHWWRVRSIVGGRPGPWSRPVSFRTDRSPRGTESPVEPFSIDPQCSMMREGAIHVSGHSNLPEGTHLHLRVCRADPLERLCATEARVTDGRFVATVPPPRRGWPEDADLILHCDCNMIAQNHPATTILGERGEAFAERGTAASHRLLQGLFAEADVLREPCEERVLLKSDELLAVRGALADTGELTVDISSGLPDRAWLTVHVFREFRVNALQRRHIEVRAGVATTVFRVDPDADYRVVARFSPDMQYEPVRSILGEEGEHLGTPEITGDGMLGIRRVLSLSDLAPESP